MFKNYSQRDFSLQHKNTHVIIVIVIVVSIIILILLSLLLLLLGYFVNIC